MPLSEDIEIEYRKVTGAFWVGRLEKLQSLCAIDLTID